MSEDFLDLTLDEAAEARIAHADFLSKQKDWAVKLAGTIKPFMSIAQTFSADTDEMDSKELENHKEEVEHAQAVFPLGLMLVINQMNELYDLLQTEAVKVLGAAFELQDGHHEGCDGTKDTCGHADHWNNK